MTRRAAVARRKGNFARKHSTRNNVEQETRKARAEKRCWKGPEYRKGIKDPRTRGNLLLQIEGKTEQFNRKALGLEIVK
jgi:hypothetical protein